MRYKTIYIILFLAFLLGGIVFLISNRCYSWFDDKDVTVITSLVALLVSIVALALADPKLKKFNSSLEIITTGEVNSNGYFYCIIRLFNLSKEPLIHLKFDFRYPRTFFSAGRFRTDLDYFKLKDVIVINNDKYRFLGCKPGDNYADIEHLLALENLTENAITSIHADGMEVKTFVLTPEMAKKLAKGEVSRLKISG